MIRFTKPTTAKLEDPVAENNRREIHRALEEVQRHVAEVPPFPTGARSYLGRKVFSSSGQYTPTNGCRCAIVKMVGGGGGGGGTTGGANFAFGGGGWSGTYWEKVIRSDSQLTGGTVTIGAGGAAGAAAGNGGTGGTTSIVINGTTHSAVGGAGGIGQGNGAGAAVTGVLAIVGGSTGSPDFNVAVPGEQGIRIAGGAGWSGSGGSNPLGAGAATTAIGNGANAVSGYGGGGGGSQSAAADKTGGIGGSGVVIVEEYS